MDEMKLHQFAEKLELLGYSKRVIADYPATVGLFFRYCAEHENITSIHDIRPEHITAYHTWLTYKRHNKGEYLATFTVRTRLGVLKTFYSVMFREKLVEHDYSPFISLPKRNKTLPRNVPSEADMKKLLESIEPCDPLTRRDRALLELLYATGLRNQEARTITLDNLDLTERTLFVTGKGSKDRIVPVGDWVMPYLLEYLHTARPKLINAREPADLLFLSKNGRMITQCNLGDLIRKYARRAGLKIRINPHAFRHACATHLLKAGADIRYVQELLGHADLSSTQIYTRIDISFLKKAHRQFHPRERFTDEC